MKRLLLVCICLLGFIVSDTFVSQDTATEDLPPITIPISTDSHR